MQIDRQTEKELDLFKCTDGGPSIFEILNKTVTSGGSYCLRQKFLHPLNDINLITDVQETVSFLKYNINNWKFPFSENEMNSLQNYITSNIDPITSPSCYRLYASGIKFYIINKDAYNYLKDSIIEISKFLNTFLNALQFLNEQKLPTMLHQFLIKIQEFISNSKNLKLLSIVMNNKRISFFDVFRIDETLRIIHKNQLQKVINAAFELDTLLSMAKATHEYNLNFPEFSSSSIKFEAEGLYHLSLQKSVPYNICVPNDKNILFLTGANMAGKTTFLKSVGVAVFLAHIGMAVPAKKIKLPLYNRIATSLSVNDSIFNGVSYFYSEVLRVKQIAQWVNSGKKIFVLFDELFKGTNVKDAFDASSLIIKGFSNWNQNLFIISSHLTELENELKNEKGIDYYFFESSIENGKPKFSYKLLRGVSNERLGMLIINNENIMQLLRSKENDID